MHTPGPLSRLLTSLPLWPMLLGILAGVLAADLAGTGLWLPMVVIGSLLILAWRRQSLALLVSGLIMGNGMHGMQVEQQRAWMRAAGNGQLPMDCLIRGTLMHTGQHGPFLVRVKELQPTADQYKLPAGKIDGLKILLNYPGSNRKTLRHGDIIEFTGLLQPIPALRNPHGFDRQKWLHRLGVDLMISPRLPVSVSATNPLHYPVRTMTSWRNSLREKMTLGLAPESGEAQLIRAVVLGERPRQSSAMIEDFRHSGTLHVFAVSGLHVGMVGTIIASLLWMLRLPRWALISGVILGMAVYAGITGLRPPSVRAVIMATVFLSGFLLRRQPSLINSLAASAIAVLIWDGHQLFTPGFQLSYGVLLALALASAFWMRLLQPMATIDPFMPRVLLSSWQERFLGARTWLRNSLAVSLAAWMGSAPLIWIHFGIITPIAILAGIPLMLLVFCVLSLTMIAIPFTSFYAPAGEWLNRTNGLVARATLGTARIFATIPGGHYYIRPSRPEHGRIIVFDLPGGGGANLIDIGGGILFDSGRADSYHRHVLPTLTAMGVRPDSLIVSHADSGHSGSMSQCLAQFSPKQALIPRTDLRSKSFREFLVLSAQSNCRLIIPHSGQKLPIESGVELEVLHAPIELAGSGRADDTGLVIRLHWQGWKILFMGDAGYITETRLLESGRELSADVIISGRNRDDYTGREEFYRAVAPQVIISSNCNFPVHERIPGDWYGMTSNLGITTFDQNRCGALTLSIEKQGLVITPTLGSESPLKISR